MKIILQVKECVRINPQCLFKAFWSDFRQIIMPFCSPGEAINGKTKSLNHILLSDCMQIKPRKLCKKPSYNICHHNVFFTFGSKVSILQNAVKNVVKSTRSLNRLRHEKKSPTITRKRTFPRQYINISQINAHVIYVFIFQATE